GIEREERRSHHDRVALAHGEGLYPPGFVGAHEDEVGLDPALELCRGGPHVRVDIEREGSAHGCDEAEREQPGLGSGQGQLHVAPFRLPPVSTSRCASRKPVTSSGSMPENRPSQRTATRSGATTSCG